MTWTNCRLIVTGVVYLALSARQRLQSHAEPAEKVGSSL